MKKKLVSIIIPTYNEAAHIEACLDTLLRQSIKNFEILIVDDGSTDETIRLVKSKKNKCIQVFKQPHKGPGAARNLGALHARGGVLVFVDADMTFEQDFIEKLVAPILNQNRIGTFSKEEYVANMDNPWARAWSIIRGFEDGRMHSENHPDKQPVFRAITKESFDSVKGFEEDRGYDDDWSLSEKLNTMADVAPGARFYHHNPDSAGDIFKQSKWLSKRTYRFGLVGKALALVRSSFPLSLCKSLYKVIKYQDIYVGLVQIVYDWGIVVGITESILDSKTSK